MNHTLHFFDTVTSTQEVAKDLLLGDKITNGAVVVAKQQTNGKGRGKHSWFSPQGSLSLTIAYKKNPVAVSTHVPFLAGLAVIKMLTEIAPLLKENLHLRWPNDVLVDGKKIAGILVEQGIGPAPFTLIGIGCNILANHFPDEIKKVGVTLAGLIPFSPSPEELITPLLYHWDEALSQYRKNGFPTILDDWKRWWRDKNCQVKLTSLFSSATMSGTLTSIDSDGLLVLSIDQHTIEHCDAGAYHVNYYHNHAESCD